MIRTIRGVRVMLDRDLAKIYGVPTFRFNEAIKRNRHRFPTDFMFQLTRESVPQLESCEYFAAENHSAAGARVGKITTPSRCRVRRSPVKIDADYRDLVQLLDRLTDEVGEDENHPLASLMDVLGVLIEKYEDEHVPQLAE